MAEEPQTTAAEATAKANAPTKSAPPIIEKEFELAVYDITMNEATGKEDYRPVSFPEPVTVTARSQAELQSKLALFKQCGQLAKVTRIIREKKISADGTSLQEPVAQLSEPKLTQETGSQHAPAAVQDMSAAAIPSRIPQAMHKPRYFKVGDVEIKDDNGKIYQKQWMRLTESESSNIRVVNDKNNATVNLSGKHIEMKKWVLVEDSESVDESESLEKNLH